MGSRGPAPKENAVRRNQHSYASEISSESRPGRELPAYLKGLCSAAKHYWKTWSEAPQTAEWLETDWEFLIQTTVLVDSFYKEPKAGTAGEIRQREGKLGGTVEDRARLRMKIETKPEEGPEQALEAPAEVDIDQELYEMLKGS